MDTSTDQNPQDGDTNNNQNIPDSSAPTTPDTTPKPEQKDDTTPPTLPSLDTPIQEQTNTKLEEFIKMLNEAIATDLGVIENTHFALRGISILLETSEDLWRFYKTQLDRKSVV